MKRIWQILNILSVAFALFMNYIVGAQIIDVPAINEVSDTYATLLTPATYAFSIWSLIYFLLIVLAVYQAWDFFKPDRKNSLPMKLGPSFILANIGNALWTYVFVSGLIGLSVIILLGMVAALFLSLKRLDIATHDAPIKTILFVWWPLMFYAGWILVASIVNVASWLASIGIQIGPFAALAVLAVLCSLLLVLLYTRNLRELVVASTWGLIAIGVHLLQSDESVVAVTSAFTVSSILLTATAVHGYMNRHKNVLRYVKELA